MSGPAAAAAAAAAAPEYEEYIQTKLSPVLEALVTELLLARPEDPIAFMISKLCSKAKLPDPTAETSRETEEMKKEIVRLQEEVRSLGTVLQQQQQQQQPQQQQQQRSGDAARSSSSSSSSSSNQSTQDTDESEAEDEEEEEEEAEIKIDKIRGFNKMRQSVCAEVYGHWNKKQDFVPPVYEKTPQQKERLL
ncbi:CAMP-dependent protein kinase regulatory subunit, putative, partial [Eimeria necatrix]